MSTGEDVGRSSYLDLLIAVLSQHEKNMDKIIEKIEKLSQELTKATKSRKVSDENQMATKEVETPPERPETLIYMKIKLNRPLEEVLKILESLKE